MGFIRWLLAIAVLVEHSEQILGFNFIGGSAAVRTFFMISGFYMTLILNKKYLKLENSYRLFITNRFLRLYPVYWLVFLITLAVCAVGYFGFNEYYFLTPYLTQSQHLNPIGWVVVIFSNLFIFLQSTLSFVDFYQGDVFLTKTNPLAVPGWHFLLVPQAWSIGLELSFYAFAPFFAGRSLRFVIMMMAVGFGTMGLLYMADLTQGPWGQRFFISGFLHFSFGTLTYKLYETYFKRFYSNRVAGVILAAWVYTTLFNGWFKGDVTYWFYFAQSFASIPFVFELTKNFKWDRYIGEFSYPVYLCHYVFIGLVAFAFKRYGFPEFWLGETAMVVTMAASLVLLRFVSIPIDRIREDRVLRTRSLPSDTDAVNAALAGSGELKGVVNADKQV